jgi:erythritol kinase
MADRQHGRVGSRGLIGLDAGTSVVKAVLFDENGQELAVASSPNPVLRPRPGWVEQDMEGTWQVVRRVLSEISIRARTVEVAGLGVTGQGDGTWLVGKDGRPIRHAILWLDGRAARLVERWQAEGLAERYFQVTGTAPTPCLMSLQLLWLARHEPETLRAAHAALHAKDWIFYRLTGEVRSDPSDMAHAFCDVRTGDYALALLEEVGLGPYLPLLPPLRPNIEGVARLTPRSAQETGLPAGLPITCGPFDVAATALGLGCTERGDACTILGSAGIHEIVLDSPVPHPPGIGYTITHGVPGRWLRMISNMAMTLNIDWYVDQFCGEDRREAERLGRQLFDYLEERISAVPVGSRGVLYHPYIDEAGERGPFVRPAARAQFFGLSTGVGRHDLLRALYEGLCFATRHCYDHLPGVFTEVRVAGGGTRSRLWVQMLADITGKTMVLCRGTEFGARGAAMVAGVASGVFQTLEEAKSAYVAPTTRVEPDRGRTGLYSKWYLLYRDLIHAQEDAWERRQALLETPTATGES